ncbi:hypothetical protein KXD97_00335 [Mycobacterium sp. SMC-8]|uniref:hypothetical protein n=1 Tax=Mycobacterium sp. SMC-8 TaxID=2857060 RepID=UPI0021B29F02|nr:hypothetical protein [Mycobacterium sp. SMC-8]UXA12404.1 hypothetical protein KXD97_00335 [Mycobacterium sp. SMC-8]
MTTEPELPILDAPRDRVGDRTVLHDAGHIHPFLDETESCFALPVRVTHNPVTGIVLELGPYSLARESLEQLREAVNIADYCINHPPTRRTENQ